MRETNERRSSSSVARRDHDVVGARDGRTTRASITHTASSDDARTRPRITLLRTPIERSTTTAWARARPRVGAVDTCHLEVGWTRDSVAGRDRSIGAEDRGRGPGARRSNGYHQRYFSSPSRILYTHTPMKRVLHLATALWCPPAWTGRRRRKTTGAGARDASRARVSVVDRRDAV